MASIKEMMDTISHKDNIMTIVLNNGEKFVIDADNNIPYCNLHMVGLLHNVEYHKDYDVTEALIEASYSVIESNLLGLSLDNETEILNIFPQYDDGKIVYSIWIQGRQFLTHAVMTRLNLEEIQQAIKDEEEELIGLRYRNWEVIGLSFVDKLGFKYKVYCESDDGRQAGAYFKTLDKMSILEKLKELNQEV